MIEVRDVSRLYRRGVDLVHALEHVTLDIPGGRFVALMGPSGSGKSTLMNLLGCLDRPSHGRYEVNGVDVATLDGDRLAALRRDTFGFVFQRYNLLTSVTAAENVELPAIYAGRTRRSRMARAQELLAQLGLGDRTGHRPNQLSGGQQQRVSIARAIVSDPSLLVCDEPTGDLDRQSAEEILTLLQQLNRAHGKTIMMVTHDPKAAEYATHTLHLDKGTLAEQVRTAA